MAIINSTVKPFAATAYLNGKFVPVTDADLKGKWSIFFFYPADFTFVCPTELGDMADLYPEFQKIGVEVYSVSTDTHFTHKAWHDASDTIKKIAYPMIGDPTGAITRGFDVMIEEEGLALRGTFVVDPEGRIKVAEIHDLGIGRDASDGEKLFVTAAGVPGVRCGLLDPGRDGQPPGRPRSRPGRRPPAASCATCRHAARPAGRASAANPLRAPSGGWCAARPRGPWRARHSVPRRLLAQSREAGVPRPPRAATEERRTSSA